ncbi:MAG: hypothetical protein KR126chlam6_00873 [Candidatus Anoxychlamydiales bacterium]|nr:hypothetical protein [Candidatus Anoxychlamydiales bacterium]
MNSSEMSRIRGINSFDKSTEYKKICPESDKTKNARKKLEKQFEAHGNITPEALQKALNTISKKLHHTSYTRVAVERESMGNLFDENNTSALPSAKVKMLAESILASGSCVKDALAHPKDLKERSIEVK